MKKITCIIVDDDVQECKRLEKLLGKIEGIELIASIYDPVNAFEEIFKKEPDIVFLEIEMNGRNGFEIMREMRTRKSNTEFILISSGTNYLLKAINNAVMGYLIKPIDFIELKESIQRYFAKIIS